ncbi:MAG: mechanosensitive ion channel family protein [Thermodesulfobacteriota bacterium]
MEQYLKELGNLKEFIIPAAVFLAIIIVLLIVRGAALKLLRRGAASTTSNIDDVILAAIRTPSIYWSIAIGLYVGVAVSSLPVRYVNYITKGIYILIIISITLAAANLAGKIFAAYISRSKVPLPTTGLTQAVLKGTILVLGFLIVLSLLGISITPLLTALGVGGLAVALALQDSLSNFFAGLHVLLERSVRVGDFIKLESGEQGYVKDITWRTTRIRMLGNNEVIIPNGKLSQSIVTNYYLPEKWMSLLINVGVSYDSDPEHVERVLTEEAMAAIGEIPGLVGAPEADDPFVRFIPGFGDSSLDFTLICKVKEFVDQYLVQHELRKRIFKRFRAEGIEIPFPHRTVYVREEKEWNQ